MSPVEKEGSVEQGQGDSMPPTYDEAKGLTEGEPKVNITSSDTKIEMGKEKREAKEEESFKGLSKDELMQYANDPFWVRLRWALFIMFWVIWVAMLAASVVIIIYAPKCPSPDPKQWWQKGPVYKVDVASFPNPQGFPNPDLNGVVEKLDYLVSAGVGSVYLTSLLSPSDLLEVKREYGTMEDWASLARALQERGVRVIVDFNPSQTSEQHIWFEENKPGFYKPGTNQLDLENSAVQGELKKAMESWLTNGVDGFVIHAADKVPETLMQEFRDILEAESLESGIEKVLMTADGVQNSQEFSGVGAGSVIHLSLPEDLLGDEEPTAQGIKDKLDTFLTSTPAGAWPAFTLDTVAHGEKLVDALTMLKMLLPGTLITQAGEELGIAVMDFSKVEDEQAQQHLELFSLLSTKLRHQDAILFGDLTADNTFVMGEVFGLTRVKKGSPGYIFVINLGSEEATLDLSELATVPESIRVLEGGAVMAVSPRQEEEVKRFDSKEVTLAAGQAKIFNFVPKF